MHCIPGRSKALPAWLPLLAALAGTCLGAAVAQARQPDLAASARAIVAETNRFRQAQGLAGVAVDPVLAATAGRFAAFMARTDRYGHEADGREPVQRARAEGYDDCLVDENIAYEFNSEGFATAELAEAFAGGWEHSPPHRANMLDPDATAIGVGIAQSRSSGRFYAVQVFGRPRSASHRFKVANPTSMTLGYEVDGEAFELAPHTTMTHEVCRSPVLAIRLPGDATDRLIHPADDARYVVRARGRSHASLELGQP